jgi:hypothetical protein
MTFIFRLLPLPSIILSGGWKVTKPVAKDMRGKFQQHPHRQAGSQKELSHLFENICKARTKLPRMSRHKKYRAVKISRT